MQIWWALMLRRDAKWRPWKELAGALCIAKTGHSRCRSNGRACPCCDRSGKGTVADSPRRKLQQLCATCNMCKALLLYISTRAIATAR
jgi:hypothetical protein